MNNVSSYQRRLDETGRLLLGRGIHWITGLHVKSGDYIKCLRHAQIANDGTAPTIRTVGSTTDVRVIGGHWTGPAKSTGMDYLWDHDDLGVGEALSDSHFHRMKVHTSGGWRMTGANLNTWNAIKFACQNFGLFFDPREQSNGNTVEGGSMTNCGGRVISLGWGVMNKFSLRHIHALRYSTDPAIFLGNTSHTIVDRIYFENLNREHAIEAESRKDVAITGCYLEHGATLGTPYFFSDSTI